ncbi:hypothetical protein [Streptomyces sp. TR06-5]|uniref:hypothetical protein n=1 Tax=unclassified Streptomyces TaxID=2593676 RepID=UPI0039A32B24
MGRIRVGRSDVEPDTPSHVAGIHQGNEGPYEEQPGHHASGKADARRSTGIGGTKHDAIAETMPNLPPG